MTGMELTWEQRRELLQELAAAGEKLGYIQEALDHARQNVDELVIRALRAGITPGEVDKLVPLSRETVRTLARIAGIPPAPRGGAPMSKENRDGLG